MLRSPILEPRRYLTIGRNSVHLDRRAADVNSCTLTFTAPRSNSGFEAPPTVLKTDDSMVPETDFEPGFSGKHDKSVLGT
ncbi:PhnD/SsuA/transferrin family substrate-binding protein [Sedimentitalea nanhaiensis]|uniref:PhnD/SsuA/transferrin family substrate-binding protein n=1 Tax=Sedimentitalea nanhaiensis TaxID=999627 RepID=UPI002ADDDF05|nr:PhnD/SsuA/transferrin family substrate-binding protein [Sedimentitalea nanhaiensis]